jgi:hypothetical protein
VSRVHRRVHDWNVHICGVCGIQFEPTDYQVVANGLSYHSVDCAVRALDRIAVLDPIAELAGDEEEVAVFGRVYSITGSLGMPTSRRPTRRPVSDDPPRRESHAAGF